MKMKMKMPYNEHANTSNCAHVCTGITHEIYDGYILGRMPNMFQIKRITIFIIL